MGDLLSIRLGARKGLRRATSAIAWYERGLALERVDGEAAIAAYRHAIAGRPDLADAHCNLGRLLHDRGAIGDAEACYRRAAELAPDVALYAYNLGVALEDRGAHDEAIAAYERAIALDAATADAHYNLARLIERRARAAGVVDELLLRRAVRHLARYRQLRAG